MLLIIITGSVVSVISVTVSHHAQYQEYTATDGAT